MDAWVTQLRRGLIELCVLAALGDGEAYGYQIVERLGTISGLQVTESTIYPLLARLRARPMPYDSHGRLAAWTCAALLSALRCRPSSARGNDRPLADYSTIGKPTDARRRPMTTSIVELSPSLQSLVDERLDTIERVLLMAGVSRGERRGILGEVEMHVFELLGRRTTGEPTREDVLAVLAHATIVRRCRRRFLRRRSRPLLFFPLWRWPRPSDRLLLFLYRRQTPLRL